jgi:hypothetical protein
MGIEPFGAALEAFGYSLRDFYTFPRTHLLAAWYAPPKDLYEVLPRMFVSQLQVGFCQGQRAQSPVNACWRLGALIFSDLHCL